MTEFRFYRASGHRDGDPEVVEIATIDDLRKLSDDESGDDLILSFGGSISKPGITVYNDYLE